ncbi:MAG: AAA family ATPase [Armatimonadota bacterium]|nr:AAA family ATPase [Armatimonadota bacterium]
MPTLRTNAVTAETPQSAASAPKAPPPAYFHSLTVENFRCFGPSQTLDLSDGNNRPAHWTIILGENGVGKTTLLQCLAVFRPERDSIRSNDIVFVSRMSELANLGFVRKIVFFNQIDINTSNDNVTMNSKISISAYLNTVIQSPQTSIKVEQATIQGGHNFFSYSRIPENISGLIAYGYGASRRMGKAALAEQRTEDTTASLFSDDVDLINAEEWLLQADYAASRAKNDSDTGAAKRRDQVKDVLIGLLPDVTDIHICDSGETIGAPPVEFQTPYGWVTLGSLSLGYRTLITWMVDLASRLFDRYPNSPNPLAEPAVVLVDEIDLHLHPKWQRELMGFLTERFPNTQFIATAHSPLVVQAAQDANIVLLRREGDHVVIDNDVERIQNWRVDQILTSELFGLDSARPPQLDGSMAEREKILAKPRLTKADERRLKALEAQIGRLPTGETPEDIQAMDIIRRAAELLKSH